MVREILLNKVKSILGKEFIHILFKETGIFWTLFFQIIFILIPLYFVFRRLFPNLANRLEEQIKDVLKFF